MSIFRIILTVSWISAATLLAALMSVVSAKESYPSKPVRIIVPAAPGGGLDITTRLVAQKMAEDLGQSVIVENRAGGDTLLGTRLVKDAPADGYTLLAQANGFTVLPALKLNPGYDPVRDFAAIGVMVRAPQVMAVGAEQPYHGVQDFIARAKDAPRTMSFGSAGVGGPPHIGAAMFLQHVNIDILHVPYKGNGAALPDVAAGRVDMIFGSYVAIAPYIDGGKLKALGITSTTRFAQLPDVPTFIEQNIDYTYYFWLALFAPVGTPQTVIDRLAEALHHAVTSKDLSERFIAEGSDPTPIPIQDFERSVADEVHRMSEVLAGLNIAKQ